MSDDLGQFPGERPTTARERIFAVDPVDVGRLIDDAELCDLREWSRDFVDDLRRWIARGQTVTQKQYRTLQDIVARGR